MAYALNCVLLITKHDAGSSPASSTMAIRKKINDAGEVFDFGYLDQFAELEIRGIRDETTGLLPEIDPEDPDCFDEDGDE